MLCCHLHYQQILLPRLLILNCHVHHLQFPQQPSPLLLHLHKPLLLLLLLLPLCHKLLPLPPPPPPPHLQSQSSTGSLAAEPHPPLQRTSSILELARSHTPSKTMKKLNWQKIPKHKTTRAGTLWEVSNNASLQPKVDIKFEELEELFSRREVTSQRSLESSSSTKSLTVVTLLDTKMSLNVSIFLKQFKLDNGSIVGIIRQGEHTRISIEQLNALNKLLPDKPTVSLLISNASNISFSYRLKC